MNALHLMLKLLLEGFCSLYLLWWLYLAVMNLKQAQDAGTLSRPAYLLGLPLLGIGYVVDFFCNVAPTTVIFLEPPREYTVSERLRRLVKGNGWRKTLATWFAAKLLNPFSPGGPHIEL